VFGEATLVSCEIQARVRLLREEQLILHTVCSYNKDAEPLTEVATQNINLFPKP
jgi:hypothetical protein